MTRATQGGHAELTPYEERQVHAIAEWKSQPPNPFAETIKMLTLPGASALEKVIPDRLARGAIEKAYDVSAYFSGMDDVKRLGGVADVTAMRQKQLEVCDRIARRIGLSAQSLSFVEGAATGAGGAITTIVDIPLLFILSLRTILKIGHCYGYRLDTPRDRQFVLGVLITATSTTLNVKRERLWQLREIEEWLLEETQEEVVAEEALSLLFQLEVFDAIPGVGAISGGALNLAFMRRVENTARHVFQERWLREHGKVAHIEPAEVHARALATGVAGTISRVAYTSSYAVGFCASLPFWLAGRMLGSKPGPLVNGTLAGASAAAEHVDALLTRSPERRAVPGGATA